MVRIGMIAICINCVPDWDEVLDSETVRQAVTRYHKTVKPNVITRTELPITRVRRFIRYFGQLSS